MDKRGLLFVLFFLVILVSSCNSEPEFAPCQIIDCGDGECCQGEDATSCPQDCSSGPSCGDGSCNGDESCNTCSQDCGSCCGDGACNFEETCGTCSQDCGECSELNNCEISTTSPGTGYIEVLEVSGYDNAHASVVDQSDYSLSVWCYAPGISITSGNNAGDPGVFLSLKDLYNSHVQSPTIGGNYPWYVGFGETYSCEVKGSCESDEFCLLRLSGTDNAHVQSCDDSDVGAIHYSHNICCEEEWSVVVQECGDGVKNQDSEECDGSDFGGQNCTGLNYDAGMLTCTPECLIDESSCYYHECGNNIVDPGENCDGDRIDYCLDLGCNSCVSPGNVGSCIACTECGNGGGDNDPCTEETYYPSDCTECTGGLMGGYDFDSDGFEDGNNAPCIANGYYLLEIYGHNLTVGQNSDCSGPSYGDCYSNNILCNYVNEEFRNCYTDITPGVPFFDWVSFLLTSLFISFYYLVDRKQKVL